MSDEMPMHRQTAQPCIENGCKARLSGDTDKVAFGHNQALDLKG